MMFITEMLGDDLVTRLGWVLVHFLWQGVVVAAGLSITLWFLRRLSANSRYLASCAALALAVVLPVATWVWLAPSTLSDTITLNAVPVRSAGAARIDSQSGAAGLPARVSDSSNSPPPSLEIEAFLPLVVRAWLIGMIALALYRAGGWLYVQHLRRSGRGDGDPSLLARLNLLRGMLRINRIVRIVHCPRIDSPAVVGVIRPAILLPLGCLLNLTPQQIDAILAHELAHIRRHDYLVSLIQTAIETVLFFHPAIWWISRRIRIERENCCDDLAVAVVGDRRAYAQTLATLEELRSPPSPALAARGGSLLARVARILRAPEAPRRANWWPAAALIALAVLACITTRPARTAAADPPATQPARTVTVICTHEGQPVQGAEVYIIDWCTGVYPMKVTPLGPVLTDADGIARFDGLPAPDQLTGSINAYARVPGKLAGLILHAPNLAVGARRLDEPVRIELIPSIPLRGKLTLPEGIAGDTLHVRVDFFSGKFKAGLGQMTTHLWGEEFWPHLFEHKVAADGTFTVPDTPEGAGVWLLARGPGVATRFVSSRPDAPGGISFDRELWRESVMEGVITYEDGHAPAAGVLIHTANKTPPFDTPSQFPIHVRSDANGRFRIPGLTQGVYTLKVQELPSGWTCAPIQVRVERDSILRDVKLVLERGRVVSGTVVDANDQRPISGCTVAVTMPWDGNPFERSAPTNDKGQFEIRAPLAKVRFYVFNRPQPYGRSEPIEVNLAAQRAELEPLQFRLGPWVPDADLQRAAARKGGLRGRVEDPAGKPLGGVVVQLRSRHPLTGEFWASRSGPSKEDGSFEFTHLDDGKEYQVDIPLWSTTAADAGIVTVEAGTTKELPAPLVVSRRPAVSRISGTVTDDAGRPVAVASVSIEDSPGHATTKSDGRFSFELYDSDKRFTIDVQTRAFERGSFRDIKPGTTDLVLELKPIKMSSEE